MTKLQSSKVLLGNCPLDFSLSENCLRPTVGKIFLTDTKFEAESQSPYFSPIYRSKIKLNTHAYNLLCRRFAAESVRKLQLLAAVFNRRRRSIPRTEDRVVTAEFTRCRRQANKVSPNFACGSRAGSLNCITASRSCCGWLAYLYSPSTDCYGQKCIVLLMHIMCDHDDT